MRDRARRVIAVVAIIGVAGCQNVAVSCACTQPPSAPTGSITRDAAIAAALDAVPASSERPTVIFAEIGPQPFGDPTALAWLVRLQGSIAASPCPSGVLDRPATASDPPCLDGDQGLDAVIDAMTGRLIGWTH